MANESESRRWNDPDWTDSWPKREQLTSGVTPHLLQAIGAAAGQRVCDIGSGGGQLALALAEQVGPAGEVVGLDISAPLTALATRRASEAGVGNVRFAEVDVQSGAFEDGGRFDLVVSQFGVMFFDEPTKAFTAIRSLLRPGGRLVFACWQSVECNPWHTGVVLRALLPGPPTPAPGKSPVGPFAFGDDEYVGEILEAAGFTGVRATPHSISVRGSADAVVDVSLLSFMGVPEERREEAEGLLEGHLARFSVDAGSDLYDYPLAFWVVEALAPTPPA